MGTYYRVVNLDKRETLRAPDADKDYAWNHPDGQNARVVLWALWRRWNGDRIAVVDDAGAFRGPPDFDAEMKAGGHHDFDMLTSEWPNVWDEVEKDYLAQHWNQPPGPL